MAVKTFIQITTMDIRPALAGSSQLQEITIVGVELTTLTITGLEVRHLSNSLSK